MGESDRTLTRDLRRDTPGDREVTAETALRAESSLT
jgi:hypothetical protein